MRKILIGILGALFLVVVVGCVWQYRTVGNSTVTSRQTYAMDTLISFTAYGRKSEEAVDAAVEEVRRLDALLSTGSGSSEISRLNSEGSGELSEETADIVEKALELYETTGGLFDLTIYPLKSLWGFPTQEYHVPSKEELAEVLPLVDASEIRLEDRFIELGENQQIDLGGIAKGYTAQRVIDIYGEYGLYSGMVYLGGDIQVMGEKPDGTDWRIGIQDPFSAEGDTVAVLNCIDAAVVTSGGYERYFEEDGQTYVHIIDPVSGYPASAGLSSVTIVTDDGMLGDGLATALYIMGLDEAYEYWLEYSDEFEMVLIDDEGQLYVSEGLEGDLESDKEMIVLNRY